MHAMQFRKIQKSFELDCQSYHHHVLLYCFEYFMIPSGGPFWLLGDAWLSHAIPPLPTGLTLIVVDLSACYNFYVLLQPIIHFSDQESERTDHKVARQAKGNGELC